MYIHISKCWCHYIIYYTSVNHHSFFLPPLHFLFSFCIFLSSDKFSLIKFTLALCSPVFIWPSAPYIFPIPPFWTLSLSLSLSLSSPLPYTIQSSSPRHTSRPNLCAYLNRWRALCFQITLSITTLTLSLLHHSLALPLLSCHAPPIPFSFHSVLPAPAHLPAPHTGLHGHFKKK